VVLESFNRDSPVRVEGQQDRRYTVNGSARLNPLNKVVDAHDQLRSAALIDRSCLPASEFL
jgi:hypothetical protein